jgi:2-dehydro-3-deoxyglucarate aldolase
MSSAYDVQSQVQPQQGSIGTLIGISSPPLTEMISSLGFDFLFLDMEHGGIADHELVNHVMASNVPTLVRLCDSSELAIKRAADSGTSGLVVPHVRSGAMAADIVRWAHYPPQGERSVGLSRNTLLGYGLADALKRTDMPSIVAQIEDLDAVKNIEAIAGTPGVISVFVGPYDLSASLGVPGGLQEPVFMTALESIVAAARAAGKLAGIFAPTPEAWAQFQQLGYDYVVLRSDSLFIVDGATSALGRARRTDS